MKKVIVSVVAALVLAGGLFSINASASFVNGRCDSFREYPEEKVNCDDNKDGKCTFSYEYEEEGYVHKGWATVPKATRE